MICPKCHDETGVKDKSYKPPEGYDPSMKKYKCQNPKCKHVWYQIKDSHYFIDTEKKQSDLFSEPTIAKHPLL